MANPDFIPGLALTSVFFPLYSTIFWKVKLYRKRKLVSPAGELNTGDYSKSFNCLL